MNTNIITLTRSGARPDDLAPMITGEARDLRFRFGPVAGGNSLTGFGIECCPGGIGFGVPAIVGTEAIVRVTAGAAGDYTLVATGTLSSGEVFKGQVRLSVEECGE